ncbi:MAG: type II toxin-antitoxin system VapC family toxin [Actinobacteria bacterium]|nr:type II toxin-antitoxin system VapC family toxin [Actinomycetota bacterium]
MRFWDTSAVVPVLVVESSSSRTRELADDGTELAVWWATLVECVAAIARRERRGELDADQALLARTTLKALMSRWTEIPPTDRIRKTAQRLVSVHEIRTADAFQLAAALAASDEEPETVPVVTLDERLALAARREGFPVLP